MCNVKQQPYSANQCNQKKGIRKKNLVDSSWHQQPLKKQRFGSELFSSIISTFISYFLFHGATKITRFSYSHLTTELCQLYRLFIWFSVQATVQVCSCFSLHVTLFFLLGAAFLQLSICRLLSGVMITNLKLSRKTMITTTSCCYHPEIHSSNRSSLN